MNNKIEQDKAPLDKKITEKRRIGNLGEDVACIYLKKQGYSIVDRNYLRKYGEIDIVAKKDGKYHFVEVKSVSRITNHNVIHETDTYKPEDNIHQWKLKRLARVMQAYILDKKVGDDWQFDIISVVLNMKTRRAEVTIMADIVL